MKPISNFNKSVSFASRGLFKAWQTEANLRWEIVAALAVIALALIIDVSLTGVAILILTSAMVIALELFNTMIEAVSDLLKPRLNQYVAQIKDISSAAVAIAALGSIGVAICILLPPLLALL